MDCWSLAALRSPVRQGTVILEFLVSVLQAEDEEVRVFLGHRMDPQIPLHYLHTDYVF